MKDNLILKAYRSEDNKNTINIDLQAHTFGYEIYRIIMMLLNKILELNSNSKCSIEEIDNFFDELKSNYKQFYNSKE